MVSKRINEMLVQFDDVAISEDALADATSELQKDIAQLEAWVRIAIVSVARRRGFNFSSLLR
jgi:hypothetical protein